MGNIPFCDQLDFWCEKNDLPQLTIIKWIELKEEEISFGSSQINERIKKLKESNPNFSIYKSNKSSIKYCCGALNYLGNIDGNVIEYDKNNYLFQGKMSNGEPIYGELTMFNLKRVYKGSFKNKLPEGEGTLVSQKGFQIKGIWQGGTPLTGRMIVFEESSTIEFTNSHRSKTIYQFDEYPFTKAKVIFEDGRLYQGQLNSQRKFHGRGKFTSSSADYTYEGQWKQNQRHGEGIAKYKNQTTYQGNFVKGKRSGYGKMTFADGKVYQGWWQDGQQHGEGTLKHADGTTKKCGKWQYGQYLLS